MPEMFACQQSGRITENVSEKIQIKCFMFVTFRVELFILNCCLS